MKTVIGLTGMSGSGKSTVAQTFASLGAFVIDCDAIAHEALYDEKVKKALAVFFGNDIIDTDGNIIRKKLAAAAFVDEASTEKLNAATHPYILSRMNEMLDGAGEKTVCVIDAPLLFNCGLDALCTVTVAVAANKRVLVRRIMERDGISADAARQRLSRQSDMPRLIKKADIIINNDGDDIELLKAVAANIYNELIYNDTE